MSSLGTVAAATLGGAPLRGADSPSEAAGSRVFYGQAGTRDNGAGASGDQNHSSGGAAHANGAPVESLGAQSGANGSSYGGGATVGESGRSSGAGGGRIEIFGTLIGAGVGGVVGAAGWRTGEGGNSSAVGGGSSSAAGWRTGEGGNSSGAGGGSSSAAGGIAAVVCSLGQRLCHDECVNDQTNAQACGETCANCEAITGKGSVCTHGACACTAGAAPKTCGAACVDLDVDRANCGDCGNACKSGEICSSGTCQLECGGRTPNLCHGGCADIQTDAHACGAGCVDCNTTTGLGSNCVGGVCSCSVGVLPITCNGLCLDSANDPSHCGSCGKACKPSEYCANGQCQTLTAPPSSACDGVFQYAFDAQAAYAAPGQPVPSCALQKDGSANMDFSLPTREWASCDFALTANLNAFDADNRASGAMEIEFCANGAVPGPLNLWYGSYPTRKKLTLLPSGQIMQAGCRTVYRAPEDAVCHWSNPDWAGDCTGHECQQCGGKCNMGCPISFASAKLTLTAEQPPQAITQTVTLTLKAVRFLPSACTCISEAGCSSLPDRSHCLTSLFQSRICPASAQPCGACVPPNDCPRRGQDCEIDLKDRICAGIVRCQGTRSLCDFVDPSCPL